MIMKGISLSDGTRADITAKTLSNLKIPAAESLIGKEFGIDANGDVTVKDMSIQLVKGGAETFLKPWPVG